MPLPTIADCFRVAFDYANSLDDRTATNVMHFLAPTSDEDELFGAIDASVTTDMWYPCTNALSVAQVTITRLDGTPDGVVFGPSAQTGAWPDGAGAQDSAPAVCALVKLSTGATGRSGRGRIYLPWVSEGNMTNGNVDGTARLACTAAWVAFANDLVADDKALAVASYVNAEANQVLDLACESRLATQRKRQRR